MSLFFRSFRSVMLGVVSFVVLLATAAAKPTRVNLATLAPTGTSFHVALQEMAQAWKKAPDGGLNLVIFPDGRMGDETDMVRKIRPDRGQLQAGLLTIAGLTEIDLDTGGLQNIPMAYRSLEEAAFVRARLAPRLEATAFERGFKILGWCDSGWWRLFTKKPVNVPDDLRGEKMIILRNSPGLATVTATLGMQPVELNPTDILVSLQTGLITVAPAPPIYALQGQFYLPAPHMLELNWLPLVGGLVLKRTIWEQLTPAQQKVVQTSAQQAMDKITSAGRREMTESIAAMEKRGLQVERFTGAQRKLWTDFFASVQPQARGTLVPPATFDEVMALLEEFRAGAGKELEPAAATPAP